METYTEQTGQTAKIASAGNEVPFLPDEKEALLKDLYVLPGSEILDRILRLEKPRELIRKLPSEDFFWLVKKIGEDDCFPLLELASVDQWQYLLDLEIWQKDRLDISHISHWMNLLQQADCKRLVKWLLSEGRSIAYYYFLRTVEVVALETKDEVCDIPDGFMSLGGIFYIKVIDQAHRETIGNIISAMAVEDFEQYQDLFLGLAGLLPSVLEEELYRLRNVRLAEHGFLPFEEAITVYSPLGLDVLKTDERNTLIDVIHDEEVRAVVPIFPLLQTGIENVFMEVVSGAGDPVFLDRLRLEFAGLVNQIIAAEGTIVRDTEVLVQACRKAARIVNLAIEGACGCDLPSAENLLRHHPLTTLFRVGFGMVLKLKWEAERWLKGSWFYRKGLELGFWGEQWGSTLSGLLEKKPRLYIGPKGEAEYKNFERISELDESRKILHHLMELDSLLEQLVERYAMDRRMLRSQEMTFHPLLFNLWARRFLKLEPCFSGISLSQAKDLFHQMRTGNEGHPFQMHGLREAFIRDFIIYASNFDPEATSILRDTLSLIWQEFVKEYEWVSIDDLDVRYSKFVTIDAAH
ncbi:MAG: hypothetical protein JRI72_03315 [Deltaproteobacteria bacterium]|nr:hypothetical protein [Deltaproteobacteria bacterium]